MKNLEQLPAIDENVLDGVAGGSDISLIKANAMVEGRSSLDAARSAAKLPFSIAGAAMNFAGDLHESWGEFLHSIGNALSGGGSAK
jgi:hypothetical protein